MPSLRHTLSGAASNAMSIALPRWMTVRKRARWTVFEGFCSLNPKIATRVPFGAR